MYTEAPWIRLVISFLQSKCIFRGVLTFPPYFHIVGLFLFFPRRVINIKVDIRIRSPALIKDLRTFCIHNSHSTFDDPLPGSDSLSCEPKADCHIQISWTPGLPVWYTQWAVRMENWQTERNRGIKINGSSVNGASWKCIAREMKREHFRGSGAIHIYQLGHFKHDYG